MTCHPQSAAITPQVRQTFLEPVEWQLSHIRKAFFHALPVALVVGANRNINDVSAVKYGKTAQNILNGGVNRAGDGAFTLPRPPVLAEIVRGPFLLPSPQHGAVPSANGFRDGEAGARSGLGGERRGDKDFDFRKAFAVYEDRDLVACPPLREVGALYDHQMPCQYGCRRPTDGPPDLLSQLVRNKTNGSRVLKAARRICFLPSSSTTKSIQSINQSIGAM